MWARRRASAVSMEKQNERERGEAAGKEGEKGGRKQSPYTYAENMICRFYSNYQREHTYLCSIDYSSQKEANKSSMFSASECKNMATRHKQAKETTGVGFRSVKEGFLIGIVMMKGHSSDIK